MSGLVGLRRLAVTGAAMLVLAPLLVGAETIIGPPSSLASGGFAACVGDDFAHQAGESGVSGSQIYGSRATIEGQSNPLCTQSIPVSISSSWQWEALEQHNATSGNNLVQIGYGRCAHTNNNLGLGSLCDGNLYYYWAWGSDCGSGTNGSGGVYGVIPLRLGSQLSSPPSTLNYYVIREVVSGTAYYDGYVNGSLLVGLDALGVSEPARVPVSSVCWDSSSRDIASFGETYDAGDSMGGWVGSTKNHLDYTSMQYTIDHGWISTNWSFPQTCNGGTGSPYSCTIVGNNHIYLDTDN